MTCELAFRLFPIYRKHVGTLRNQKETDMRNRRFPGPGPETREAFGPFGRGLGDFPPGWGPGGPRGPRGPWGGPPLAAAAIQVSQAGTPSQKKRAVEVLNEARRSLYGILGEIDSEDETEAEEA